MNRLKYDITKLTLKEVASWRLKKRTVHVLETVSETRKRVR